MKIAVFGNYGVRNLGDDLILRGLLEMYKGDEVIVFCGHPEQVKQQFGVESFSFFPGGARSLSRSLFSPGERAKVRAGYEVLKKVDKILIGGGGILVDHHLKAIFLWWNQLRMIERSGVPFEFVGNSFELRRWWSQRLFLPFLRKAGAISVRDSASQAWLQSLGVSSALVDDASIRAPLPEYIRQPRKQIALALCRWGIGEQQVKAFRHFIAQYQSSGYEVVGLAFQTRGDDDRRIFTEIDPNLKVVTGLEPVLEAMSQSEAIVAMRYHAVVLSYRLKVPLFAISYQEKIRNFMADQGLASAVVPIQKIDEQNIQELFRNAVEATKK